MESEEINNAIFKSLGFMDIHRVSRKTLKRNENGALWMGTKDRPSINYGRDYVIRPDFNKDLNAMHEAEKVLTESQQGTMIDFLVIIERQEGWNAFHATAAQRAETFLKTLNLWK